MEIKVAVFDDNATRRDGLKLLVDSMEDMTCVGAFTDCRDAVAKVQNCQPDVVLMDIDMPFVNGIEGVRLLRAEFADLKIIMQTIFEEEDKILSAICAGANGYILKQKSPLKLIEGIKEVMEGGAPMTPVVASRVLRLFSGNVVAPQTSDISLTAREKEVLTLLVEGNSYKMIADKCNVSYPTVNTHISHIYQKLQVNSVAAAVSKAIKEGIV